MNTIQYTYYAQDMHSVREFAQFHGTCQQNRKMICFVKAHGVYAGLQEDVMQADIQLGKAMQAHQLFFKRITTLPILSDYDKIEQYTKKYENWIETGMRQLDITAAGDNRKLSDALSHVLAKVCKMYGRDNKRQSVSILKNFTIKMMYWLDEVLEKEITDWTENTEMKIIAQNVQKETEFLFYYLLTQIGADVLLLQMNQDLELSEYCQKLCVNVKWGELVSWKLSPYVRKEISTDVSKEHADKKVVVHIPVRERTSKKQPATKVEVLQRMPSGAVQECHVQEKSFEELARLASSVVMVSVHDASGEVQGSGSGIMIGRAGYILTNHHVISHGQFYSVRIEEEDTVYRTDEVIKYHNVLDLALIRIDRQLSPLPLYQGEKALVRGQKVVAIGSPLGLFNSVSDGIISGFRRIDDVDMIQYTAPTSHGSSGGALLNMFGEVIGISTAGIDSGQNINLAVSYEDIAPFIRGFQK